MGELPDARSAGRSASPTVLSLFTGLGGLDLGLEAAGFISVGSVEISGVARRSLKANRGGRWPQLEPHDIREVAKAVRPSELGMQIGELDVIACAPPCQPFSMAAQWARSSRHGLIDERGRLIFHIVDLVTVFQPRIILLENVAGFVRGPTSVLQALTDAVAALERSTGLSYGLQHRIFDANEFGVAQHRKRAIIVLSRVGPIEWPLPLAPNERPVSWDAIGHLDDPGDNVPEPRGSYAELLPSIPEGWNYQWHTDRGGGLPLFGYRTRYWSFLLKLAKDRPSWTLAAQPGPSTGPFHWTSRPLTVGEMLRLQSFPPEWIVEGSRREQVCQVGNATPPALAEALGWALFQRLSNNKHLHRLTLAEPLRRPIPPPQPIAPTPSRFAVLAGDHAPHPGEGKGPAPREI